MPKIFVSTRSQLLVDAVAVIELDLSMLARARADVLVVTLGPESRLLECHFTAAVGALGADDAEALMAETAMSELEAMVQREIVDPKIAALGGTSYPAVTFSESSLSSVGRLLHCEESRKNLRTAAEKVKDSTLAAYMRLVASITVEMSP